MRLLFDENLSRRLIALLAAAYPGSSHVELEGLRGQADGVIWHAARSRGFAIVSKDNDFRQLSFLHGAPPKVVWLSVANANTGAVAELLLREVAAIGLFCKDDEASLLVLELATDPTASADAID